MKVVTNPTPSDWSPADNPHAIAISEAQWWRWAVQLAVLRLRDPDDQRIALPSSRQIDARQFVFALRQLLSAARLADVAMEARGVDAPARDLLAQARQKFEDALPGVKDMRDALMHFEDWSRGEGRFGPAEGSPQRWRGPPQCGPRVLGVRLRSQRWHRLSWPLHHPRGYCRQAAKELSWAIYQASRTVDQKIAVELLARTVEVLTATGVSCNPSQEAPVWVRVKEDSRVWLSLITGLSERERFELSERIVNAFTDARLHLVSIQQAEDPETANHLARGEALYVESNVA